MDDRAASIVSPLFVRSSSVRRPSHAPDPLKGGDVYKWAVEQAMLIRIGQYDAIDGVNVADGIESVGNSEFRQEAVDRGYRSDRIVVVRQTRLPLRNFPDICPYTWDAIMERPFIFDSAIEIE